MCARTRINGHFLLTLVALATSMTLLGQALPAMGQFRPPAGITKAGNREGAATRGSGDCRAATAPPLTTLVPTSKIGLTTAAYPAFYWYMPDNSYNLASFTLYEVEAQREKPVYSTYFLISGKSGIAGLRLPEDATLPPLAVGTEYRWKLELICDPDDPSGNVFADGWIMRVRPSADVVQRLNTAPPTERHQIYAEAGYWYDTLRELVVLRQANPQDASLLEAWKTLLESEAVQLNMISKQAGNP